jgi:hypothetical protein
MCKIGSELAQLFMTNKGAICRYKLGAHLLKMPVVDGAVLR